MSRSIVLVLVAVLLAVQPVGRLALADEPAPAVFTVVGVAAATLRAEPNGSSIAVALVPAGRVLTQAGPEVVTAGVTWRQVRTAEGQVGFLPAGFLAPVGGGATAIGPAAGPIGSGMTAAPSQAAGTAPAPGVPHPTGSVDVEAAPSQPAGAVPAGSVGSGAIQPAGEGRSETAGPASVLPATGAPAPSAAVQPSPTASPAPSPGPPPVRTTLETRRGQQVTITQIDEAPAPDGRMMGAGRIVVRFKPGATEQGEQAAHRTAGSTFSRKSARLNGIAVAQVDPNAVQQALAAYRSRADVAWAEPDYVHRASLTPNDPDVGAQWGLQKIGTTIAWDVGTGEVKFGAPSNPIQIAILDSGVFSQTSPFRAPDGGHGHADLRNKVTLEANFTNATTGWDDWYGHGTQMAGIAGAWTNTTPAVGMAGIGYKAQLFNGKVLDDTGRGFESWVAEGIVWAADNGAEVISLSLSAPGACSQTMLDAVTHAWGRGAVVVASAGNGGADQVGDPAPESPASCPNVISVGAINQSDARPSFSNYGPSVHLAAPGVDVYSTNVFGTYSTVSGTSPAAPHVAGVAALLFSTAFGTSNQLVFNRLLQSADPIVGTGSIWGYGRVNAAAAVGPASCSPRPKVTINNAPNGVALNVTALTQGLGNAVRFIQAGGAAGPSVNALVSFPTPASQAGGTTTYVPRTVSTAAAFQVKRQTPGAPTTLPFIVTDGCGGWNSLAGGGPNAGF